MSWDATTMTQMDGGICLLLNDVESFLLYPDEPLM